MLARINDTMGQRIGEADRWHGHILKAIDGSSVKLMDTQQNQKTYPQPSVQKEGCGFPVMGICGVLNLSHGGWQAITAYPHREHDLTPSYDLLDCFGQGDLVLADRAFCSYELTALLNQRGAHSLMRLHQSRERSLDWRKGKRIGKNQRLITWSKPSRRDGSKLTREQWDALPGKLEVRYIRFSYRDRVGATQADGAGVTTLAGSAVHGWEELAGLYVRRWEIELRLRDVKTTMGMECFPVKTPEMAHKTLKVMMVAYNLVRALMQEASMDAGVRLAELSFKASLDHIMSYRGLYAGRQKHRRKRRELHGKLLSVMAASRMDIRPGRHEPRAVKKRPKSYQLLTSPRGVFKEIPHRSRYKKTCLN